jgi:DNA invertase Pin-like site-specific DNA recombinase
MARNLKDVIKEMNITKLTAYSRKSRDKEGEGLEKHMDVLKDFATSFGLPLVVEEEVESSETLNRPVLNNLRMRIKAKQLKCLVVYRLDRLSRKTTDLERLLQEFKFYDLLLIEVNRNRVVDYNEMLQNKLEAVMNDLYQEGAKMVLTAGRKKAVALYGNHLGEPPLGYVYNKETKKLQPNDKAFIVRKIFELYLEGYSNHKIATILNKLGYRTRKGQIFKGKGVWQILTNDKYIGVQTFGKQEWFKDANGKKFVKKRPQKDWIVYQNAHEPIISEEKFKTVQLMLDRNRTVPVGARKGTYTFTSFIRCGKCGSAHTFTKVNGKVYMRACQSIDYETGIRCGNTVIPVMEIEKFFKDKIMYEVRPIVLKIQKKLSKDSKGVFNNKKEIELKELKKERNHINVQIDNLIELQLVNGINDRLIEKSNQLEAQLKMVNSRIQEFEEDIDTTDLKYWTDKFIEMSKELDQFLTKWQNGTEDQKNILVKKYVNRIIHVKGEKLQIVYTEEIQELLSL